MFFLKKKEESLNIDIEKFLSELNDHKAKTEKSTGSLNSQKSRSQKEEEINKLGEEIISDK